MKLTLKTLGTVVAIALTIPASAQADDSEWLVHLFAGTAQIDTEQVELAEHGWKEVFIDWYNSTANLGLPHEDNQITNEMAYIRQAVSKAYPHARSFADQFEALANGSNWHIHHIELINTVAKTEFRAPQRMYRQPPNAALTVRHAYVTGPGVDVAQLIVEVELQTDINEREIARKEFSRTYTFQSAPTGSVLRNFEEGEKESLIAFVEKRYEDSVTRYPHNEKSYRKERDGFLKVIDGRTRITPRMAIAEGWPQPHVVAELQTITDGMVEVIRTDLQDLIAPIRHEGKRETFYASDRKGIQKKFKGVPAYQTDTHTVYQIKKGNLIAIPIPGAAE